MSPAVARPAPRSEPIVGAVIAGGVAALLGGLIWAAIVLMTHYEVGWVAWGVGALVGLAVSRGTPVRGATVATLAAALAGVGLLTGKFLILKFTTGPALVQEIKQDGEMMTQAAVYQLRETGAFPASVQRRVDAVGPTDAIPDPLWVEMIEAGAAHLAEATRAERERMAQDFAHAIVAGLGTAGLIRTQLTAWDLLWFLLAVTTAWRLASGKHETPEERPAPSPAAAFRPAGPAPMPRRVDPRPPQPGLSSTR